jgi:hypothetical protein
MEWVKKLLSAVLLLYGLGITIFAILKNNEVNLAKSEAVEQEQIAVEAAASARAAEANAIMQIEKAKERKSQLISELENCK